MILLILNNWRLPVPCRKNFKTSKAVSKNVFSFYFNFFTHLGCTVHENAFIGAKYVLN